MLIYLIIAIFFGIEAYTCLEHERVKGALFIAITWPFILFIGMVVAGNIIYERIKKEHQDEGEKTDVASSSTDE